MTVIGDILLLGAALGALVWGLVRSHGVKQALAQLTDENTELECLVEEVIDRRHRHLVGR